LGSSNGTFVNDIPIAEETVLKAGDLLRVGPAEFEVPGGKQAPQSVKIDDDIVEWLTDGDTSTPVKDMDTTILTVPGAKASKSATAKVGTPAVAPTAQENAPAKPAKRVRKEFKS